VDPDNRLVAAGLEQRWNSRLLEVQTLEQELELLSAAPVATPTPTERTRLLAGGRCREGLGSPAASPATRKRIIRTLIDEIVVRVEDSSLTIVIRWNGGDHTSLRVAKNQAGQHRWTTNAEVVELVAALARLLPDQAIAAVLNRAGKTTGRGNSWTRSRVCMLRNNRNIPPYREGERAERGEATLDEAAEKLKVSEATVRRLIAERILPAHQFCKGAPWTIRIEDLGLETVLRAADQRRTRKPPSESSRQKALAF
jgi:excisionase family DNA binding protein